VAGKVVDVRYIPKYIPSMDTAKLFQNGRSQAVRLPQEYRFDGKEVFIKKVGELVVLVPRKSGWRPLLESVGSVSDDFMTERNQPPVQKRKDL